MRRIYLEQTETFSIYDIDLLICLDLFVLCLFVQGFGIWYLFPLEPVGPSADYDPPVFALEEAMNTPCWTFDNNVVHSNLKVREMEPGHVFIKL